MNKISKAFLSCVYSILCLSVQAQDQTTWTNDFSNTGEKLKTVGRGTCSIADNAPKTLTLCSASPNGKTIHFLSKPVLLKMQTKCRYGQVSVTITVSTATW